MVDEAKLLTSFWAAMGRPGPQVALFRPPGMSLSCAGIIGKERALLVE